MTWDRLTPTKHYMTWNTCDYFTTVTSHHMSSQYITLSLITFQYFFLGNNHNKTYIRTYNHSVLTSTHTCMFSCINTGHFIEGHYYIRLHWLLYKLHKQTLHTLQALHTWHIYTYVHYIHCQRYNIPYLIQKHYVHYCIENTTCNAHYIKTVYHTMHTTLHYNKHMI